MGSPYIPAEQKRVTSAMIVLMSPLQGLSLPPWADATRSPLMPSSCPAVPRQCRGAHFGPFLLTSSFSSLRSTAGVE